MRHPLNMVVMVIPTTSTGAITVKIATKASLSLTAFALAASTLCLTAAAASAESRPPSDRPAGSALMHSGATSPVLAVAAAKKKPKDSDRDGMPDAWERKHKLNPKKKGDAKKDADKDGLTNLGEYKHRTNPLKPDTDRDGLRDGAEVNKYRTNPLKPDTDRDGLRDGAEVNKYRTNPLKPDTDRDGWTDGEEVNEHGTDPLDADSYPAEDEDTVEGEGPADYSDRDVLQYRDAADAAVAWGKAVGSLWTEQACVLISEEGWEAHLPMVEGIFNESFEGCDEFYDYMRDLYTERGLVTPHFDDWGVTMGAVTPLDGSRTQVTYTLTEHDKDGGVLSATTNTVVMVEGADGCWRWEATLSSSGS